MSYYVSDIMIHIRLTLLIAENSDLILLFHLFTYCFHSTGNWMQGLHIKLQPEPIFILKHGLHKFVSPWLDFSLVIIFTRPPKIVT